MSAFLKCLTVPPVEFEGQNCSLKCINSKFYKIATNVGKQWLLVLVKKCVSLWTNKDNKQFD